LSITGGLKVDEYGINIIEALDKVVKAEEAYRHRDFRTT